MARRESTISKKFSALFLTLLFMSGTNSALALDIARWNAIQQQRQFAGGGFGNLTTQPMLPPTQQAQRFQQLPNVPNSQAWRNNVALPQNLNQFTNVTRQSRSAMPQNIPTRSFSPFQIPSVQQRFLPGETWRSYWNSLPSIPARTSPPGQIGGSPDQRYLDSLPANSGTFGDTIRAAGTRNEGSQPSSGAGSWQRSNSSGNGSASEGSYRQRVGGSNGGGDNGNPGASTYRQTRNAGRLEGGSNASALNGNSTMQNRSFNNSRWNGALSGNPQSRTPAALSFGASNGTRSYTPRSMRASFAGPRRMAMTASDARGYLSINPGGGKEIDMSSDVASIKLNSRMLSEAGVSSVTVSIGGENKVFKAGDMLTGAEYVAVSQKLDGEQQTLIMDSSGRAVGGTFSLNSIANRNNIINASELVIPQGVTAIDNYATESKFVITGDLINNGTIQGFTSNSLITSGTIVALDITNASGAVISTTSPLSVAPLDLTLQATNNLSNAGSITSSGNLTLQAGGLLSNTLPQGSSSQTAPLMQASNNVNLLASNITNSGTIKSVNRDINIQSPSDITINATGGEFKALAGNINIRDASFNGTANTTLTGGDYLSKNFNVYSGQGNIVGNIGQVTGTLNTYGLNADVKTATPTLTLGNNNIIDDPTYANSEGSINIVGNISVGENLTLIARDNITSSSAATITANNGTSGMPITFIAGADQTGTPPSGTTDVDVDQNSSATAATVYGASANGGNIILASGTTINSNAVATNGAGAPVVMAAFADANGNNGRIDLTGVTINSGGLGNGSNGDVTLLAGGMSAFPGEATLTTGSINTMGGTGGGGAVTIATAQPFLSNGAITYNINGVGDSQSIVAGSAANGTININGAITSPSSVNITSGNSAGGNINVSQGVSGSAINLTANGGGNISNSPGGLLTASSVNLSSGSGNIGDSSASLLLQTSNLTANTNGSVYLQNDGAITLAGASTAGSSQVFSLKTSPGDDGFGSITLAPGASITTPNGTINLESSEEFFGGGIFQFDPIYGSPTLNASNIILADTQLGGLYGQGNGNIFVSTGNGTAPVNLTVNTARNASVNNVGQVNLVGSSSGGLGLTISTTPDANGNGAIVIASGATLSATGSFGSVTLWSSESGSGTGGVSQVDPLSTTTVFANRGVNLSDDIDGGVVAPNQRNLTGNGNGDFSVSTSAGTNVNRLIATTNGNVTIANAGRATVVSSFAGANSTFSVSTTPDANGNGSIVVAPGVSTPGITAGAVVLASSESGTGTGGISQNAALTTPAIAAGTVTLSDTFSGGNVGSGLGDIAIGVASNVPATAVNLSANTQGNVTLRNADATMLSTSSAGGEFQLISAGDVTTIGSVTAGTFGGATGSVDIETAGALSIGADLASMNGGVKLVAGSGALQVQNGVKLNSLEGNITIQNTDTSNGSISIGSDAVLTSAGVDASSGNVYIVIGSIPTTPTSGTTPANVSVNAINGGQVFFGSNGIDAASPTNTINVSTSQVVFENAGSNPSAISLGGGVQINSGNALSSLDLSNASVANFIVDLQNAGQVGGTLQTLGGGATGGNAIINPTNLFSTTLSADNVPANVVLTLQGFQSGPLTVNLSAASTSQQVIIGGTQEFVGGGPAVLSINSNGSGPSLVVNNGGLLTSDGDLTVNVSNIATTGTIQATGALSVNGSNGLSINESGGNTGNFTGSSVSLDAGSAALLANVNSLGSTPVNLSGASVNVNSFDSLTTGTIAGVAPAGSVTLVSNDSVTLTQDLIIDAGTVSVSARNSVITKSIDVSSSTGSAGSISLTAGSVHPMQNTTPLLQVDGSLAANALGSTGDGGTISLLGGTSSFVIGDTIVNQGVSGSISANAEGNGNGGSITLATAFTNPPGIPILSSDITIAADQTVSASALGSGNGGTINISGRSLTVGDGATIATNGSDNGAGGSTTITAATLNLGNSSTISSYGSGTGNGGIVTLVPTPSVTNFPFGQPPPVLSVNMGSNSTISADALGDANGGSVSMTAGSLSLADGARISADSVGTGNGGSVTIASTVSRGSQGQSTPGVVITQAEGSSISADAETEGNGGTITITGRDTLADNSRVSAYGSGSGNGGSISFLNGTALQNFGQQTQLRPVPTSVVLTGANSLISTDAQGTGNGGSLSILGSANLADGASLSSSSLGGGNGGSVTATAGVTLTNGSEITATGTAGGSVSIGGFQIASPGPNNFIGSAMLGGANLSGGSQISVNSNGQNAGSVSIIGSVNLDASQITLNAEGDGNGGLLTVNGGTMTGQYGTANPTSIITMTNGSQITANAEGTGNGGSMTLKASPTLSGNSKITADAEAEGNGGSITFLGGNFGSVSSGNPNQQPTGVYPSRVNVNLSENSVISANAIGDGNGGLVRINNAQNVNVDSSQITANASAAGNGGMVEITGGPVTTFVNPPRTNITSNPGAVINLTNGGQIGANALVGNGGSIAIQASQVNVGTNSGISANAQEGNGGNIAFTTGSTVGTTGPPANSPIIIGQANTVTLNGPGAFISANATGEGNGGSISGSVTVVPGAQPTTFQGTTLNLGQGTVSADGAGDGNGGAITLVTANLSNGTALTANGMGAGNGGTLSIGTANLPSGTSLQANALGSGNGGTINASSLTLASGSTVTADALGSGNGGTINIVSGVAGVQSPVAVTTPKLDLSNADAGALSASSLGGGNGGFLNMGDSNGLIARLPLGKFVLNGATPGTYSLNLIGGIIDVVSDYAIQDQIDIANAKTVSINVSTGDLNIGSITATGIPGSFSQFGPIVPGSAGIINLTASSGDINVSGNLTANDNGIIPGPNQPQAGTITLVSGSSNEVNVGVGSTLTAQRVAITTPTLNDNGSIVAGSRAYTSGGSFVNTHGVFITSNDPSGNLTVNMGPGTTINSGFYNTNIGASGTVTVNAGTTDFTGANVVLSSGSASPLSLQANSIAGTVRVSSAGATTISTNTGNLLVNDINANGNVTLTAPGSVIGQGQFSVPGGGFNPTGNINSNGGNISITSGGDIKMTQLGGQGNIRSGGGNISLTSGAGIQVNGSVDSSSTTGNGGNILLSWSDSSGSLFGVGTTFDPNYVAGSITADGAAGVGNGGNITFVNTAPNSPLRIDNESSISANGVNLGTITLNAPGQSVYLADFGRTTGIVTAQGSDVFLGTGFGGLTVGNVTASNGNVYIMAAEDQLKVVNGATISATTGNVTLQALNQNNNGSISIGQNATISASTAGAGAGNVTIAVGAITGGTQSATPANVTVNSSNGGLVLFGAQGITASSPTNTINVNGAQVVFLTNGAGAGSISLGGGVTINSAVGVTPIQSLDLSDPTVTAKIISLQQQGKIGGTLIVNGAGVATGGTVILTPDYLAANLTAEYIPQNVTLTLNGFDSADIVNIALSNTSTQNTVALNGTMQFLDNGNSNGILTVTTALNTANLLSVGNNGALTSDGSLTVNVGGNFNSSGILTAANSLIVNAGGNININNTTNSTVSASDVALNTTANNGAITISKSITGTNSISLSTNGSGNIVRNGGTTVLTAPTINLVSSTGSIGTNGAKIQTVASNVSANTSGSVYVSNTGSVDLLGSSVGGTFSVTSTGGISNSGYIQAGILNLTTGNNGSIYVNNVLNASSSMTLTANGSGSITDNGSMIIAPTLTLASTSGNIGIVGSPLVTNASTLSVNTSGSSDIDNSADSGPLTLNASTVGNTFILTSGGNIATGGVVTAPTLTITSNNGSITVSNNLGSTTGNTTLTAAGNITTTGGNAVRGSTLDLTSSGGSLGSAGTALKVTTNNLTANAAAGLANISNTGTALLTMAPVTVGSSFAIDTGAGISTGDIIAGGPITITTGNNGAIALGGNVIGNGLITLTANGSGAITQSAPYVLQGTGAVLKSTSGNIGNLVTNVGTLTVNTNGSASIDNTSFGGTLALGASTMGTSFNLQTGGGINATGVVTAPTLVLNAANGDVTVNSNMGATTGNTTITAGGNINTTGAAAIRGATLVLGSNNGSLGNAGVLKITTTNLTANAANGSVNMDNSSTANLTLNQGTAAGTYQLVTGKNITTTGTITAPVVSLTAGGASSITLGGNVGVAGGSTTLVAKGGGSISETNGSVILGNSVSLSTGSGNLGVSGNALVVNADNLTLDTNGNAYIDNTAVTGNLNLGLSNAGTMNVSTGGSLTATGAVTGTTITLQSGLNVASANKDIVLNGGSIGNTTGTTNLVANNGGAIYELGAPGAYQVKGNTVNLTAGGDIGVGNSLSVNAKNMTIVSSNGSVNVDNTGTALLTLANSSAGGSFRLSSAGPLTVNNILTGNGDIAIYAGSGALQTNVGANLTANNGSITIQNNNTGSGTITIGANTTILGSSTTPGVGNVYIGLGPQPASPVVGPTPSNVTLISSGGGQIFFGTKGITANAPGNTLNAKGRNIVFNTGTRAASAIKLGGGVNITADPPGDTAPVTVIEAVTDSAPTAAVQSNALFVKPVSSGSNASSFGLQSLNVATALPSTNSMQALNGLAVPGIQPSIDSVGTIGTLSSNLNAALMSQERPTIITQPGLSAIDFVADDSTDVDEQIAMLGATQANAALTPSTSTALNQPVADVVDGMLWQSDEVQTSDSSVEMEAQKASADVRKALVIRKGNVLFVPFADTNVETPHGTVDIAAKSVVLIMCDSDRLAVFDLDDTHSKSVMVRSGADLIRLHPGRQTVLVKGNVEDFGIVNPNESFGYRLMTHRSLANGMRAFESEYSIASTMCSVKPVRDLINSTKPEHVRIAEHMAKTTGVIIQLSGGAEPFQQILRPRATASAE